MRELFGVTRVTAIPTGVDIEGLTPPDPPPDQTIDLAFVGSMDWLPNVDGSSGLCGKCCLSFAASARNVPWRSWGARRPLR